MPESMADRIKTTSDVNTKLTAETMNLMRRAAKLAATMSGGKRIAALVDRKLRIASSRLLSVTPDDEEAGDGVSNAKFLMFCHFARGFQISRLMNDGNIVVFANLAHVN